MYLKSKERNSPRPHQQLSATAALNRHRALSLQKPQTAIMCTAYGKPPVEIGQPLNTCHWVQNPYDTGEYHKMDCFQPSCFTSITWLNGKPL